MPFALFEDNLSAEPNGLLLTGLVEYIECTAGRHLPAAWSQLRAAASAGHWVAFALNYEAGYALAPRLAQLLPATASEPLLRAWVYADVQRLHGPALTDWWRLPDSGGAGLTAWQPALDLAAYRQAHARILRYITEGDCYQVNFTFPLRARYWGEPLALAALLRQRQPVAYGTTIAHAGGWILSRSPELFVARSGEQLRCKPMKGTAARDPDPARDQAAAAALLASDKERAENLMIVDLIRNDLGRLAPPGGVKVTRLFELEHYATVHQLTSSIEAAPVDAPLEAVLAALFPCGSVTGAPKLRAMQIIHELECGPRGLYCGALGWLAPDGDFALSVPIRTLLLNDAHHARLDVGSGVVADSDAQREYTECLDKAAFARGLRTDFQLIETVLQQPGAPALPRLELHLARLAHSAAALGFCCDIAAIRAALLALPATAVAQRVSLRLAQDGRWQLTSGPLEPVPAEVSLCLASQRIDARDPLCNHKTSRRAHYDAALAAANAAGHFDALFLNHENEVAEGARSNVFVRRGERLLTPPLTSGALPGVLRAELLARGAIREARLDLEALQSADELWVGNALRGLLRVTRIEGL